MKNTDIMVGDWVEYRNTYLQVTAVLGNNVMTDYGPYGLNEIHPVHITPEILRRNGFKKQTTELGLVAYKHICEEENVIVECDSDTEKIPAIEVSWDGEHKNSIILEDARYIHELQHAMRLVGIEKEIKIL